jgi:4,5-DOPA dioxygenase extradiol
LIMGSGNIVHNLRSYMWQQPDLEPYDWARRFEERIRRYLLDNDAAALVDYERLGTDALMSAPTPDHFLPLIYIMAARQPGDRIDFPVTGFDGGGISMLSVRFG